MSIKFLQRLYIRAHHVVSCLRLEGRPTIGGNPYVMCTCSVRFYRNLRSYSGKQLYYPFSHLATKLREIVEQGQKNKMALSDTEVEKQVSSEDIICLICRFVCVCVSGGGECLDRGG